MRIYPLAARKLTEEQIAVIFAMTSRLPDAFDEIAKKVSEDKAADFHERWVLGYGHASVAEHAVLHLAVENISRLACDTLEDNRLASYTEKSSRYQVMPLDYFHLPEELVADQSPRKLFSETCKRLFQDYLQLVDATVDFLRERRPKTERERESIYALGIRREATDSCRSLLPAATLTNVGVTANARVLEHAISKLMSSELMEERDLGEELRHQARTITPTLVKYADRNEYLTSASGAREKAGRELSSGSESRSGVPEAKLVSWDPQAEEKLVAALVYRQSAADYGSVWRQVLGWTQERRQEVIDQSVEGLGPHDAPVREFEVVDYTFEFVLDYGAYREFKRHRMQSYFPQPLSTSLGYHVPPLLVEAGLETQFQDALERVEEAYERVAQFSPLAAEYLVTHAHYRRVLTKMNLRECYHMFKLRTSELAHLSIRGPVLEAMRQAVKVHPGLFRHLRLRDYPEWWDSGEATA